MKVLELLKNHFLDNKKITKEFSICLGGEGGGQPTYGKFHMFSRFFFESFPL